MIRRGHVIVAAFLLLIASWAHAQGPLLIGAEDDWGPFSSGKDGNPVGMAVDIVRAIFAEAKIPMKLVPVAYSRCMKETLEGRLAGCFDTTPDAQLRRDFLFHARPLFSEPTVIVAKAPSAEKRLNVKDLRGKLVAVTNGYTYGDEFEADRTIRREVVISDLSALRMVAAGRVDYAVIYERVLAHTLRGGALALQDHLTVVGQVQMNDLYLSFSRKAGDLQPVIKRFDAAHAKLIADGTIAAIVQRWE